MAKQKKHPMIMNADTFNGLPTPTYRYEVDPIAHLQYQTKFTKTGELDMTNKKPKSKGQGYRYFTLADGSPYHP